MQDDIIIFISQITAHTISMLVIIIILMLHAIDLCYYKNSFVPIHTYLVIQFLISSFQLSLTYIIPMRDILFLCPTISMIRHLALLTSLFSIIVICKFFFIEVQSIECLDVRQLSFKNVIIFTVGLPVLLTIPFYIFAGQTPRKYRLTPYNCGINQNQVYLRVIVELIYEYIPIILCECYIILAYFKLNGFLRQHGQNIEELYSILKCIKYYPYIILIVWLPIIVIHIIKEIFDIEPQFFWLYIARFLVGQQGLFKATVFCQRYSFRKILSDFCNRQKCKKEITNQNNTNMNYLQDF